MPVGRFVDEADAITRRILDVNIYGVMVGTKLVLPAGRRASRRLDSAGTQ